MRHHPLIGILVLARALTAQCSDPTPPAGGFAITEQLDQLLTYNDGTRTKVDVRYPTPAPSSCGWPTVILPHGLGGDRKEPLGDCVRLAKLGYLTVSFDVRGQGESRTLNPSSVGSHLVGGPERLDLAELVGWITQNYGTGSNPLADTQRLGIHGVSQGGMFCWAAAAWSGKTMPPNSRGITTFPVFKAACPHIFPVLDPDVLFPQGKTFLVHLLEVMWSTGGPRFDPPLQNAIQVAAVNEDVATARALFANDPFRQDRTMLQTSTVPICAMVGWLDSWADAAQVLASLQALPAATPRRVILDASGGHGMTGNARQSAFAKTQNERWLARWLKGAANGIENEPVVQSTVMPLNTSQELDPNALLWNRLQSSWPPPNNTTQRFWLRQSGSLAPQAPSTAEPGDTITHQVSSGWGMPQFVALAGFQVFPTMAQMPLVSTAFDSPAFSDDVEIAGAAHVRLEVTTTNTSMLVQGALFHVPAAGSERFLGSGLAILRNVASAPTVLDLDVIPVQARIPKGDFLRLRIENLPWRRTSVQSNFSAVPCFSNWQLTVEHSQARASWIDVPLRASVQPVLLCPTPDTLVSEPQNLSYTLAGPKSLMGSQFLQVFTTSGISTPLQLPGSEMLYFTPDATTLALAGAGAPLLIGSPGTVDAAGTGSVQFMLRTFMPMNPAWAGARLTAATIVVTSTSLLATNPVDVWFK